MGRHDLELGPVFQRNRATAGFDRTHVFQLGWVYELPVGKGKQFVNSGIASQIIGGWQLSGVEASLHRNAVHGHGARHFAERTEQPADRGSDCGCTVPRRSGNERAYYYAPTSFAAVTSSAFGTMGRNIDSKSRSLEHRSQHLARVPDQGKDAAPVQDGVLQLAEHVPLLGTREFEFRNRSTDHSERDGIELHADRRIVRRAEHPLCSATAMVNMQ